MMADAIRLFEKDAAGSLHEVPPDQAAARRAERPVSHVNIIVDVLWTDEEIAARKAEEAASVAANAAAEAAAASKAAVRQEALDKLVALGLSTDHVQALLGE